MRQTCSSEPDVSGCARVLLDWPCMWPCNRQNLPLFLSLSLSLSGPLCSQMPARLRNQADTSPEHVIVRPRVARLRSDTGQTPVRNRTDTVQTPARCRTDAVPKTGQKPDRHRPEAGQMPCQNTCNGGLRDWESEHFKAGCLVRVCAVSYVLFDWESNL